MANAFKNTSLVTKFAIKELLNALQMAAKVDRQLDQNGLFAQKVGDTISVRRPVYATSTSTEQILAGDTEDIEEAIVSVQLDTWKKVVKAVSSKEMTLNITDANRTIIRPAMQELAQQIESSIAAAYTNIYNFTGTPGTAPSTFLSVANAGVKLDELGVPDDMTRCAFYEPAAAVKLADGLKGVFPQSIAKKAIEKAMIGEYGGFSIYKNQSLAMHTVGVATGTPLINGNTQNVTYATAKDTWTQTLNTDGWTNDTSDILKAGDVFTIADVYSVNRRTRQSTGSLAQFVVTADADSGAATGPAVLTISPPIITSGPYQTVNAAPVDGKAITVLTGTGGSQYRQNLGFHPNAITLAMAKIDTPTEGAESYRADYEGISLRVTKQYDITLNKTIMRFDVLYTVKVQNPDFAVRTTS